MREPALIEECQEILRDIRFASPVRQSIYEKICAIVQESVSGIQERLFADGDAEISAETARILAGENLVPADENRKRIADDCIRLMHRDYLQREFEEHRRLADAYASMHDARYLEELRICNEVRGKIRNLYGS